MKLFKADFQRRLFFLRIYLKLSKHKEKRFLDFNRGRKLTSLNLDANSLKTKHNIIIKMLNLHVASNLLKSYLKKGNKVSKVILSCIFKSYPTQ